MKKERVKINPLNRMCMTYDLSNSFPFYQNNFKNEENSTLHSIRFLSWAFVMYIRLNINVC